MKDFFIIFFYMIMITMLHIAQSRCGASIIGDIKKNPKTGR